ncbi:hypothetical protein POPTR_008G224273v4 [Populus trichocarpa]|uniref:Uncharacterized protein n=1 Tax=Populus trichocarpa TaxID=3694 RepID=A0ACC0SND1_POPTR|nr:hypothetical protein POPTR_008G224273v4 [Populus trichocarpa]
MGAAGRQFGAPARSLPTRTTRLPLMRLCVHATTIPTSEPRPREQVETPERDRARTAGREGSRRDKQQAGREGSRRDKRQAGREGSRRDKRQAAGGNDGDNHAGGCLPRLGRRRSGLGSRPVTPRGRGLRGEPTHGRAHGNLMPRPRQRRALLAIPELGGPPQPRRPGLQLASTGSGHRSRTRRISKGQATSRTRRISKGQATGRGGKRRGQSCGGLSAPARKTEVRPRQQARHATSVELSSQSPSSAVRPSRVGQASNLRARAAATAAGREGSRRDKGQAAGGNDGDNHAGGCQPRLGRRRPGLGSGHITPRGRGLQGEPTHGRAHDNLMPRPRQRRALLAIPKLGGPHQPRQPGLRLASRGRGSGHRRRDVAASRRPRSSCQHLGTSTANECHAHAADKQPQRARRLGAGPEDGGRNRVVAGRKTGHRCRQYFGP